MRKKKNWKKKIVLLLLVALVIGGGVWKYTGSQAGSQDDVLAREREYAASIGDITVGVSVAGKLYGSPEQVYGTDGLTLARHYVQAGDRVAAGDKIGEYTQESLDEALATAFEEYKEAQDELDKAMTAQKDGLTSLVSRLSNDKKLNADTYSSYKKFLENLLTRLTREQKTINEKLRNNPDDAELNARLSVIEEQIAEVKQLQEDAKAKREEQKIEENDSTAQTDADLLEIQLLEDRVLAAERNVQTRRSRLLHVQALMEDPAVYSAQDGVVTKWNVEAGDEVKAGQAILELSTDESWSFRFNVEQSDISSVEEGQSVELIANAYPTDMLNGSVQHIKYIAEDDGKYRVTVRIDSTDLTLLEGMDAYGTVVLAQKEDVLIISNKAIYQKDGAQFVQVRNEAGELVEKQILTGFSDGKISEVLDGLEPGEVAVVVDTL